MYEEITDNIAKYNESLLKYEICTTEGKNKYYDKSLVFNGYALYPNNFDDVVKAVQEYNKKNNKYEFIMFNGKMYDVHKITGDTKIDIQLGVYYEEYGLVSVDKPDTLINPKWDVDKCEWVENVLTGGRGETAPHVICDLGDLVLATMPKCVMVILRNANNILCVEHMKCKNKFSLPAGTIEPNESISDAALREMKEELDLDLSKVDLEFIKNRISKYDRIDGIKHYNESILEYKNDIIIEDIKNKEPEKHPKLMWINSKDFVEINKDLFTYSTYEILKEVLK